MIIVGLARRIAMVIVWNDLARGDRQAAAVLVALNSVFQVLAFGLLGWFYLELLPGWLGWGGKEHLHISAAKIALNVAVFLGLPLAAGYLTRRVGEKKMGRVAYEARLLPRIGPWALYGLLFTIVILFALQGRAITSHPEDVARIALPLLVYFVVMWFGSFAFGKTVGLPYDRAATLTFTAAGDNTGLRGTHEPLPPTASQSITRSHPGTAAPIALAPQQQPWHKYAGQHPEIGHPCFVAPAGGAPNMAGQRPALPL